MSIVYAHTPSLKYIIWCLTARFETEWCNAWPDTFSFHWCLPNGATLLKQYKVKQVCNFLNLHFQPGKEILYNKKSSKIIPVVWGCILISLLSHNTITENMGNYTVPVHSQLPIPARFLLPCIWLYVPSTVDSSGYWKNGTGIKIWTHEQDLFSIKLQMGQG